MKRSKFTESQIVFALKEAESGVAVAEVCRKLGVSEATSESVVRNSVSDSLRLTGEYTGELQRLVGASPFQISATLYADFPLKSIDFSKIDFSERDGR